jgi:general secretion pathway protein G
MRKNDAGVTLIEMLVVVTIIALFATLTVPSVVARLEKSKTVAARVQIVNFEQALTHYKLDTGAFPTTEQGLEALRTRPVNVANWDGPYLVKEIPLDPWGHRYVYKFPGEHGNQPDIISYGADGQPGGEGPNADIVSWKN